jgi:hypothetical protein
MAEGSLLRQSLSRQNITARDVVGQFLPPHGQTAGHKERIAATQALEHLAGSGLLYRQSVHGEMHYLND